MDFGEKILQTTNTLTLNLKSLGQTYSNGSADPALVMSSVQITGENSSEFSASMPVKLILNPQETTTLTVTFAPKSQGLKIADLLIHYNNSPTPHRVPLYAIAKASGTTVTAHFRINSGSKTSLTIGTKTWKADTLYSFDNLEPYSNSSLSEVKGTDEDALYLREQSSNGDKKPFRYEMPLANGDYVVRLHFAELVWGAPGNGLTGGAGSRVMNVSLENQLRLINFDVAKEVGPAAALVKNIPVTITDGKLNIDFSANVNRPMVNAVEVYSFRSSTTSVMVNGSTVNPSAQLLENAENSFEKTKVYPNPLHEKFYIKFPSTYKGNFTIQIVDQLGKVYNIGQSNLRVGGTSTEVNVSHLFLKTGIYSLKVISDTRKTEVIKLIVM